jgi:hypothetical protein
MHDLNGNPINVGDTVMVPCTVKSITGGEEYCNIMVETREVMFPGNIKARINLNARQVLVDVTAGVGG